MDQKRAAISVEAQIEFFESKFAKLSSSIREMLIDVIMGGEIDEDSGTVTLRSSQGQLKAVLAHPSCLKTISDPQQDDLRKEIYASLNGNLEAYRSLPAKDADEISFPQLNQ